MVITGSKQQVKFRTASTSLNLNTRVTREEREYLNKYINEYADGSTSEFVRSALNNYIQQLEAGLVA